MNFLVHCHLAARRDADLLGALLPDYVKPGRDGFDRFPGPVAASCRLHLAVDVAADAHPAMAILRTRFRFACRHYAGVVADIACDHVLARRWSRYGTGRLRAFEARCYRAFRPVAELAPQAAPRILGFARHRVLGRYATVEGIRRSLVRVRRRVRGPFPVGRLLDLVTADLAPLEKPFAVLLKDLEGIAFP